MTLAPSGQPVPVSEVVLFMSATLPAVAAMAIAPVASAMGKLTPEVPPELSWIK